MEQEQKLAEKLKVGQDYLQKLQQENEEEFTFRNKKKTGFR